MSTQDRKADAPGIELQIVQHPDTPVTIPAEWCRDERLSIAARGLLVTVSTGAPTSSSAAEIAKAVIELEALGYIAGAQA